ncbi:LOW QUALITY PROTEIN: hypothetical protein QC761_610300 [Podospora bellae-mahoneyi]|uniref:Cytochrome P450 E-class, group IV n=1 Tax=Podospora bellae-mahoneyi TaxID=2093777 RepID=A0ABR0FB42_9PEZI|nr:LOW QUALITY PROTEIN: hypothetical protein QC761_610300 [Podospora bellae-mahoneyi]
MDRLTSPFEDDSPHRYLIALAIVPVLLFALYQYLLPKPIPGIAYNPSAAKSLLGDVSEMIAEPNGRVPRLVRQASPQDELPHLPIFIKPFSQPWVLLSDFRESRDILTRRHKEFDKSSFLSDGMACMGALHGIYMTDHKFRANRQLIHDLMTSTFLNGHVGPAIYNKGSELMRLFEMKVRLARGRPFSVKKDFEYASLDCMLEFAFGRNWVDTAVGEQVKVVGGLTEDSLVIPVSVDEPVDFPLGEISVYEAPEIVEKTINAIMPKLQTWWWSQQGWYKKIFDDKEKAMKAQGKIETGVEHMLMREAARAEKEGREPDFESQVFRDELFGDIVGGHHTTSGAMMWLTKYLTDDPTIQSKLRSVLHSTLSAAHQKGRLFTFEEIRHAKLPYLDAIIEEMLRINAVPVTREAVVDTTVLGCPIKKGTQVFFMSNGPGFLSPSFPVDEAKRSDTSRLSKRANDSWDERQDLARFDPERWLVRKTDGTGVTADGVDFDGAAGPQLLFGLGPRTCWGRRLAHMEMKVIIAMLVWTFQLERTPPELSGYGGLEGIARVPKKCYVRLVKL